MMFVVEVQDCTCPVIDPRLLFISGADSMPWSHIQNFRT